DGTVEHGGTTRRQLGASQQVALDLVLVAEHAEGTSDLVEQLCRFPEIVARDVVQPAVSGNDQMMVTAGGQDANLVEDRLHVAHRCVPSARPAPQPSSTLPPVPPLYR